MVSLLYYSTENDWLRLAALGIFAFACLTDAVDGYVARKFNQQTVFGQYIDPIADKLLLLGGFLAMTFIGQLPDDMHIPAWVTTAVITRDVVILTGSAIVFFATHSLTPEPLRVGKATTFFQMITLVVFLAKSPEWLRHSSCIFTTVLTIVSGIQYIRMGARLMQSAGNK
jgi:CDP-diacylglycerol--glycerol-3-phosphate 3-phosphatidyltransferase